MREQCCLLASKLLCLYITDSSKVRFTIPSGVSTCFSASPRNSIRQHTVTSAMVNSRRANLPSIDTLQINQVIAYN